MCSLGLEYFASYGMLLGLTREDRLIPWTADNDYVVSFAVVEEMWKNRTTFQSIGGLHLLYDYYYKGCATPDFMDGKLARWSTIDEERKTGHYPDFFPYNDFFIGEVKPDGQFMDERGCSFPVNKMRPVVRKLVYNGTFLVNVPGDAEAIISETFGADWRVPDPNKAHHGGTFCRRDRGRKAAHPKRWEQRWNNLLKSEFYSHPGNQTTTNTFGNQTTT
jgi:hypothetical protein